MAVRRDIITPETSRIVKNMSMPALSEYLWKLYAAGYSKGFLDGLAAAATDQSPEDENE